MEAEIPDYPVEEGYSVQDTMILKPRTLSLTVVVTNTPITFREHTSPGRVQEVAQRLQELYSSRQLITVTSAKGSFQNMGITSLSLPYDTSTKTSLEIPITLKEVLTTTAQTVTIPSEYGRGGDTGTTAGTANTSSYGSNTGTASSTVGSSTSSSGEGRTTASSDRGGSIAYNLIQSIAGEGAVESIAGSVVDYVGGGS
nr:MAG TPA: hypothetical protein [Caudoviricetes sp.]